MIPKHCSDERLLAWLDGEQNLVAAALTRRHLQACWECRSRVAQLEAAAHRLSQARGESRFLSEEKVRAARARVLRKIECRERSTMVSPLWKRVPAYALLGSLCLAGAVGLWETYKPVDRTAPRSEPAPVVKKRPEAVVEPPVVARAVPRRIAPLHPVEPAAHLPVLAPEPHDGDAALVWAVLHEMGLCRERAVRLNEDGGTLRLTGVVSSVGVKDRIASRLQTAGIAVRMDVASLDEIAVRQAAPAADERVVRVDAPGEALLIESLQGQGVSPRDAAARSGGIANASVMAADLAWSEAWAIRDLAGRFGARWHHLPEPARATVLAMARDHWSELQTLAARQRRLIGAILPTVHAPGGDWFVAIEGWVQASQDLFAPAMPVEAESRVLTMRIASALVGIEALAGDDAALVELLQSKHLHAAKSAMKSP